MPVVMLDLKDLTLHMPSSVHLITKCGLALDQAQVGPSEVLVSRSWQSCTSCFIVYPLRQGEH